MHTYKPVDGIKSKVTRKDVDIFPLHNLFMQCIEDYPNVHVLLAMKNVKEHSYTCTVGTEVIPVREIVVTDRSNNKNVLFREETHKTKIRQFWFSVLSNVEAQQQKSVLVLFSSKVNVTYLTQGQVFKYQELNLQRKDHGYAWHISRDFIEESFFCDGKLLESLTSPAIQQVYYRNNRMFYNTWKPLEREQWCYYHKSTGSTSTQKTFNAIHLPKHARQLFHSAGNPDCIILLSEVHRSKGFFDRVKYKELHITKGSITSNGDLVYSEDYTGPSSIEVLHHKRIKSPVLNVEDTKKIKIGNKCNTVELERIYHTGPWCVSVTADITEVKHNRNFRKPGNITSTKIRSIEISTGKWRASAIMKYDIEYPANYLGGLKSNFPDASDCNLLDVLAEFGVNPLIITEVDISAIVLKYSNRAISELTKG